MKFHPVARALLVILALCSVARGQLALNQGFSTAAGLAIPPSGTGGGACGSTMNTLSLDCVSDLPGLVTVNPSLSVGGIILNLQHTYVSDLEITLTHCGISVVLSDGVGMANPSADLNGDYIFRDDAALTFDAAPAVGGVLVTGAYRPDNSLDPFRGTPAGGVWTLTICDRAGGDAGILNSVSSFIHRQAAIATVTFAPPVSIPPVGTGGAVGGCSNPDNTRQIVFTAAGSGLVGEIGVDLALIHTFASDLLITLEHNGVELAIFDGANLGSTDLGATYLFRERLSAPTLANTTANVLNSGHYGFKDNMNPFHGMPFQGPWTLKICDRVGADSGVLINATLYLGAAALQTAVSQPAGGLQFNILAGSTPGNRYFKPVTLTAGNFPNGWFYGIDIGIAELVAMFNLYPSFPSIWGTFNNCVQDGVIFPGAFPVGLGLYQVAFEFGSSIGPILQRSMPQAYTIQ